VLSAEAEAPPRVDRRRTDTRDRLLVAAMRLFGEKGYGATSVSEIEGAVGLRPGSGALYRHFASKEALFVAGLENYAQRVESLRMQLRDERAGRHGTPSMEHDLGRLLEALLEFISGEQPVVQATADAASLPPATRGLIGRAWEHAYGMAADIFTEHGIPEVRARPMGVAAIGSLNHYVSHLGCWGKEPEGVPLDTFITEWLRLWSERPENKSRRGGLRSKPERAQFPAVRSAG
jgi:AcrR family transcriptional regulator